MADLEGVVRETIGGIWNIVLALTLNKTVYKDISNAKTIPYAITLLLLFFVVTGAYDLIYSFYTFGDLEHVGLMKEFVIMVFLAIPWLIASAAIHYTISVSYRSRAGFKEYLKATGYMQVLLWTAFVMLPVNTAASAVFYLWFLLCFAEAMKQTRGLNTIKAVFMGLAYSAAFLILEFMLIAVLVFAALATSPESVD